MACFLKVGIKHFDLRDLSTSFNLGLVELEVSVPFPLGSYFDRQVLQHVHLDPGES